MPLATRKQCDYIFFTPFGSPFALKNLLRALIHFDVEYLRMPDSNIIVSGVTGMAIAAFATALAYRLGVRLTG